MSSDYRHSLADLKKSAVAAAVVAWNHQSWVTKKTNYLEEKKKFDINAQFSILPVITSLPRTMFHISIYGEGVMSCRSQEYGKLLQIQNPVSKLKS